jgi:hypothetical protein
VDRDKYGKANKHIFAEHFLLFHNDAHNYKITGILNTFSTVYRTPAQQVGMLP